MAEQQKAELLKLLMANVPHPLDEPTRVLAPHGVQGFFGVVGVWSRTTWRLF